MNSKVAHVRLKDGGTYRVKYDRNHGPGRKVTYMRVTSSRNFVAFNRASWLRFVNTFSNRRSLCSIWIGGDWHDADPPQDPNGNLNLGTFDGNNFNVETLIQIIEAAASNDPTKINYLTIVPKTLTGAAGADDGWERLRQCAEFHLQALEELSIKIRTNGGEETQLLEPLIQTLFALPTLLWVNLRVPGLNLSPSTLSNLSHCESLMRLDIIEVELKDDQIIALSNALLNTRTVPDMFVRISGELENPGACGRAMSRMLQLKVDPLESVEVAVCGSSSQIQDDFHLGFVDGMSTLAKSVETDLTFYCTVSERAMNAYLETVKEKYSLIRFWCKVESKCKELYRILQFEVALNRVGRSKVMELASNNAKQTSKPEDSERKPWVELLIQANK